MTPKQIAEETKQRAFDMYEQWRLGCHLDTWLAPSDREVLQDVIYRALLSLEVKQVSDEEMSAAAFDFTTDEGGGVHDRYAFKSGALWMQKKMKAVEENKE